MIKLKNLIAKIFEENWLTILMYFIFAMGDIIIYIIYIRGYKDTSISSLTMFIPCIFNGIVATIIALIDRKFINSTNNGNIEKSTANRLFRNIGNIIILFLVICSGFYNIVFMLVFIITIPTSFFFSAVLYHIFFYEKSHSSSNDNLKDIQKRYLESQKEKYNLINLKAKIAQEKRLDRIKKYENYFEEKDRKEAKIRITASEQLKRAENEKKELLSLEVKNKFLKKQHEDTHNVLVDGLKTQHISKLAKNIEILSIDSDNSAAIGTSFNKVLLNSKLPFEFNKMVNSIYLPEQELLIIDYLFPEQKQIPQVLDHKIINGILKEIKLTPIQHAKLFDKTLYNLVLRSLYEIFMVDKNNYVGSICFNGISDVINKSNGKIENKCILSVQVKKEVLLDLNLELVEPKLCFKSLKGVSSSKLSDMVSIRPIIEINKNDKRFIGNELIIENVNEFSNIAAMPWDEFEHLIRELFEKEFSVNGGEVKVTQASRDGGVDAIAFDPDPIRGGKIVIQAKRYTNVVGVSAVRDLYGTVLNEGATKGILVTTADYGPDSYDFANGKPITLLNGSNLLHLLEKHGHKARIDIKEAKITLKENS